jgi:hypothetical protein
MNSCRRKRAPNVCAAIAIGLIAAFSTAVPAFAAADSAPDPVATTSPAAAADSAPAEDIRDIRGPKGIFPAWLIPALLAAAALLAVAGYAAWRWHRRQRPVRALLPFEIALRRLEASRGLLNPASVREFSIAISDIVREYIEAAFHVTATHRTTEEFLRDLLDASNTALAVHRKLLAEFLDQCDIAKFAGISLSTQIMESLYQSARSFVIETSKPLAPASPGATSNLGDSSKIAQTSFAPTSKLGDSSRFAPTPKPDDSSRFAPRPKPDDSSRFAPTSKLPASPDPLAAASTTTAARPTRSDGL